MTMSCFRDARRRLLRLAGPDCDDLLQGIITSDIQRLVPSRSLYAALLTPQGKYLSDFILLREESGTVCMDLPANLADATSQKILMYRLRRDVQVNSIETEVTCIFGEGAAEAAGLSAAPGSAVSRDGLLMTVDPRSADLGVRLYGPESMNTAMKLGAKEVDPQDWDRLRIGLGVPEGGVDLQPEEVFPLEAGLDRLDGVDFQKGCYVGQEVTARMRHKTVLRKAVVRVKLDGPVPARGTPVMADDRPAGTMLGAAGNEGLAQIRLDRVSGAQTILAGDTPLTVLDSR